MKHLLYLLFIMCSLSAYTQNQYFGKNRMITVLYSYLPAYNENIIESTHAPLHINFAFSMSKNFYTGIYYQRMSQCFYDINTTISTHDFFHKAGIFARLKEDMFTNRASVNIDFTLGYSNYSLNPLDDVANPQADFISRNNYQLGINFIIDVRLCKSIFLSGGAVGARTLKKGDYGFEVFPMVGISGRF